MAKGKDKFVPINAVEAYMGSRLPACIPNRSTQWK